MIAMCRIRKSKPHTSKGIAKSILFSVLLGLTFQARAECNKNAWCIYEGNSGIKSAGIGSSTDGIWIRILFGSDNGCAPDFYLFGRADITTVAFVVDDSEYAITGGPHVVSIPDPPAVGFSISDELLTSLMTGGTLKLVTDHGQIDFPLKSSTWAIDAAIESCLYKVAEKYGKPLRPQ